MALVVVAGSSSEGRKCRVARHLFRDGATSQWSARAYEPRNALERGGLEAAIASGLVVRTEAGTYFVNPVRYEAMRTRQRWAIIAAVALILIGLAVLYLTGEFSS